MIIERMKKTNPGETICLSYEECEEVLKLIEGQEERIAIMSEHGLWIPVKERLPEEKENPLTHDYSEVICYCQFGGVPKADDVRVFKFGGRHFYHGPQIMDGIVTHWQYLPEPPKEGEQEAQRDYEQSVEYAQYCERYEPTYNPEDGSM